MATQPIVDNDTLELGDDQIIGNDDDAPVEASDDTPEGDGEAGDDDTIVLFGDEPVEAAAEPDTDLVKRLRREIRERDREIATYRKAPQAEEPIIVGERPKIGDFDYDEDRHNAALDEWEDRKAEKAKQDDRLAAAERRKTEQWDQVKANYATKKAALPFPDKATVEAAAFEVLNPVQQAIIAKTAPDPALFIYAAGKSTAKLNELAAIDDPLVLAATVGRMAAGLTMKKRSAAPEPERVARGGVPRGVGKTEADLIAKAEKTQDSSELVAWRRAQKANAK